VLKGVGPGVYAAIDGPEHKSVSNAGVVIGDDGVLVVDSFSNPESARALLAAIRAITSKPIRYLVNTHYHFDHVAGDGVFQEAGATIIAHRNERDWIRSENLHLIGEKITPEQRAIVQTLPQPTLTTSTALTVWLGARRVEIRAAEGHTGGDLLITVPDANVVFCGDLLWRRIAPNTIDASVGPWIETESTLERLPEASATTFVPGHGDLATVADVGEFKAYLTAVFFETGKGYRAGLRGDALVNHVLPKLRARYGDWWLFEIFGTRAVRNMEAELAGIKRLPAPAVR